MKMVVTVVSIVFAAGVGFVSLESLSVITAWNWLPVLDYSRRPRTSIPIVSNGPVVGNRCNLRFIFVVIRSLTKHWQFCTAAYTSLAMCGY